MTPENMTRHVKSVYGHNQDSLNKAKTSANKIQQIV